MVKSDIKIKPLFGNVLIKPIEAGEKSAGGIYLPETAKKESQVGIVMAIGEGEITPDGKKILMVVKVGDKVTYKKWGGNEIKVDGEDWTIVEQKEILAILS